MKLSDFDYRLPPQQIAQWPLEHREESRLFVLGREDGRIEHRRFAEVVEYLRAPDVLVLNDTRVLPWKVTGRRATGGGIEGLLIEALPDGTWLAMFKSHGRLLAGERLRLLDRRLAAHLLSRSDDGTWTIQFDEPDPARILDEHGFAPLPPYIRRTGKDEEIAELDRRRYQTVFARSPGAIAAPTAGLHFTTALLDAMRAAGIEVVTLTLHVGVGTFQPVKAEQIEEHRMHGERYELTSKAATVINERRRSGGRVVAVGTTSVRVLETCADERGTLSGSCGTTSIFIHPPYRFRAVDALITNFHLPKSTLLMLVSAFAGRERILDAYEEAKRAGYRFFSYGDAMLIL